MTLCGRGWEVAFETSGIRVPFDLQSEGEDVGQRVVARTLHALLGGAEEDQTEG